jgi:hypothetical protein
MKTKLSTATLLLVLVLQISLLVNVRWHNNAWKKVIEFDGKGYYDLLPSTFLRHDLRNQDSLQEFTRVLNGRVLNKYYIGTPLLMSPFFAGAILYAKATGYVLDGYSLPFQEAISLAALFYLLIGLLFLKKILQLMGIRDPVIAGVLVLIAYGTNLIHYALMEPGMSHVYSFALAAAFLYAGMRYFATGHKYQLFLTAAAFALLVLVRPVNGILIFTVPFMAGSKTSLWDLFHKRLLFATAVLLCLTFFFLQLYAWHIQTGHWLVWSYPGEGFYFLHPEVMNVLFSYKKGLFVYTPLCILGLAGLISLYRINSLAATSIVLTLALATWAISSWWSWAYAGSFGQRAYVEYLPLFAIGLACLINYAPRIRLLTLALCVACFALNIIQYYQYHTEILDPNYMNAGKYKYVFLKTAAKYRHCLGGIQDDRPYSKETPVLLASGKQSFTRNASPYSVQVIADPLPGKDSLCFNLNHLEFGPALTFKGMTGMVYTSRIYLEIALSRFEQQAHASKDALLVLQVRDSLDRNEYYYSTRLNDYPADTCCTWRTYAYSLDMPPLRSAKDKLNLYIWNREKGSFCYKNLAAKLWSIRQ